MVEKVLIASENFQKKGYRTLLFAMKEMHVTDALLTDMSVEDVESDLSLLGATGVEDAL